MTECNVWFCKNKGKLFGMLLNVKFYYCPKHTKFYEGLIKRNRIRKHLAMLRGRRRYISYTTCPTK